MRVATKAGRYELQQELGRGSMGIVYRALDPVIGRTVAVKTVQLTAETAGMSHSELLTRFQTEARAAGLLAHPNIVVVYDAGEDDGLFYITMELVEGRSLQEQMNLRQPFPLPRIMRWMQQACSALEFAHQNSVIHRDIKPANLMLMADDTLKVTDFGTAKILQLNTTQTAHVIGTPSYMSPEQIKGKPVDGRTDVFSLGVVLYELLTGAKPFAGESVTSVIYKVVNEDPIPPRELDTTVHPGLSAVVQRALSKSPWARFQSCREFSDALQHYQDFDEPRAPRAAPAPQRAATVALPKPPVLGQTPWATIEETPRRKGGFAVVALLLIALIGAAGYRVYPAVQEIWRRYHQASQAEVAPPNTAPSDAAPADAAAPTNTTATVPAAIAPTAPATATDLAQVPAPNSGQNPIQSSGQSSGPSSAPGSTQSPVQSAAQGSTPGATLGSTQGSTPGAAAANSADPATAAPPPATPAAQPAPPQVAAKPPAPRRTGAPPPSQVAAEWKDLIEAKLSSSNIEGDVHVVAAGNSVTLTGKLDPAAHSKLLGQLQFVPNGLQIIDDIEYTDAPSGKR